MCFIGLTFTLETFYLLWLTVAAACVWGGAFFMISWDHEKQRLKDESENQMKWKQEEEKRGSIFADAIKTMIVLMMCVTLCPPIRDTFYTHRYQSMDECVAVTVARHNKWPTCHVHYWYSSKQSIKLSMYLVCLVGGTHLTRWGATNRQQEKRCMWNEATETVIQLLHLHQWILPLSLCLFCSLLPSLVLFRSSKKW